MKFKTIILVSLIFSFTSCSKDDNSLDDETEFKQKMREFVIGISQYSKATKLNFIIVPQNGI